MRLHTMISIAALGVALGAPAHAGDAPDSFAQVEALLDPKVLLHGVVREEDLSLLFAHLRAVLRASVEGKEAPPPPEALNRRAEVVGAELKARGALAALLFLTAFEATARQALREALADTAPAAR